MSLRSKLLLSYAQQYLSMAMQFVSMIVIARLMLPEEVGIFATGAALVAFGGVFVELGQADYLVTSGSVGTQQRRTALGIALLSSWLSAALILFLAWVFIPADQAALTDVILILVMASMLAPLSLLLRAQLLREMQFNTLLLVNTAKDFALVGGSIFFVLLGYSASGLAIGLLLEQVVLLGFALAFHFRTGWILPSWRHKRDLLRFGLLNTAMNGLSTAGQSLSRLSIGWLLGYTGLGLLNRAQKITTITHELLLKGLLPVLLPYLSKTVREGGDLQSAYIHKLTFISGLAWPFFLYMAIAAEPIVLTLLGKQWTETIPVIRVLCLGGLLLPFSFGTYKFLVALDLLKAFLPLQVSIQILTVLLALAGSTISLTWACLSFVVAEWLKGLVSFWLISNRIAMPLPVMLAPFSTSALMTAFCGVITLLAMQLEFIPVIRFIWVSSVFACAWLGSVYLFRHPFTLEINRAAAMLQTRLGV